MYLVVGYWYLAFGFRFSISVFWSWSRSAVMGGTSVDVWVAKGLNQWAIIGASERFSPFFR